MFSSPVGARRVPAFVGSASQLLLASALRALLLAPTLLACAPETDLWSEAGRKPGLAKDSPAVQLASPRPGETEVPPNLASVVLRLPSTVGADALAASSPTLRSGAADIPTYPEGVSPCPEGGDARDQTCWTLAVPRSLQANSTYAVALAAPLVLADGTRLTPSAAERFTTAAAVDDVPPVVVLEAVELGGACLHVSFGLDEPAAATVMLTGTDVAATNTEAAGASSHELGWPAGQGSGSLDVWLPFAPLRGPTAVQVEARDRAGNDATSSATVVSLPDLPALVLTEILSNPAGPEPTQEFVELHNEGEVMLELGGLILEDGKGRDVLPAAALPPGAFALVVPSGFDATAPGDVPPRPGTLLVRVDTRLGADGLANDRDVVRLRLPDGTLLSSYDGFTSTSAASWNGRSLHRRAGSVCDGASSWSSAPLAPTPGWE